MYVCTGSCHNNLQSRNSSFSNVCNCSPLCNQRVMFAPSSRSPLCKARTPMPASASALNEIQLEKGCSRGFWWLSHVEVIAESRAADSKREDQKAPGVSHQLQHKPSKREQFVTEASQGQIRWSTRYFNAKKQHYLFSKYPHCNLSWFYMHWYFKGSVQVPQSCFMKIAFSTDCHYCDAEKIMINYFTSSILNICCTAFKLCWSEIKKS